MIILHPELLHVPFQAWALLGERLEEAELGPLAAPLATEETDAPGTVAEMRQGSSATRSIPSACCMCQGEQKPEAPTKHGADRVPGKQRNDVQIPSEIPSRHVAHR